MKAKKTERMGIPPLPYSEFFEVHGSELKPDPVGNLGQAPVLCIPHGMLLFGVRKDPFDGLLAPLVQLLIFRRIIVFCESGFSFSPSGRLKFPGLAKQFKKD